MQLAKMKYLIAAVAVISCPLQSHFKGPLLLKLQAALVIRGFAIRGPENREKSRITRNKTQF
jgi:hypothetical protein